MKEFIILMATAMPESMLLNELKEAIEEHMLLNTEELDKATDMISELDKIEKVKGLFNLKNN